MPYCVVCYCRNTTDPKKKSEMQIKAEKYNKISFHRFPRDQYRRKIWLTALGINWEPSKTATVCSHHFTENDFEKYKTNRILKETAIPESENIPNEPVKSSASEILNPVSEDAILTYSIPREHSYTTVTLSRPRSSENIHDEIVNGLSSVSEDKIPIYSISKEHSYTTIAPSRPHSTENISVNNFSPVLEGPISTYSVSKEHSYTTVTPSRSHSSENIPESVKDLRPVSEDPISTYSVPKEHSYTTFTPSRSHSSENIPDEFVNDLRISIVEPEDSILTYSVTKDVRVSSPSHTTKVHSSTSMSPSRLYNSPETQRIRESYKSEVALLRQELYKTRQKEARYKKRLEILNTRVRALKKKNLSVEDLAIIESTRIVYERAFLMNLRNSPISQTPPRNIPSIPTELLKNPPSLTTLNPTKNIGKDAVVIDESAEQFEMDM